MVKLNKIYTRTGDDGSTGLVDGSRLSKGHIRVQAYGDVDETNSLIGLARTVLQNQSMDRLLASIQNDLFDLGADLATPISDDASSQSEDGLRILPQQVHRLEQQLDALNADLAPLSSFVLPGGTPPAAYLHLARTVCRRAERHVVQLSEQTAINPPALHYLNRLSDLLFVAARWCNDQGHNDVIWQPGANRPA